MTHLDMLVYYEAAKGLVAIIAIGTIIYAVFNLKTDGPKIGIAASVVLIICVSLPSAGLVTGKRIDAPYYRNHK